MSYYKRIVTTCFIGYASLSYSLEVIDEPYYGNAQTSAFKHAINSANPWRAEDQEFVENITFLPERGHYYAKAGLGRGKNMLFGLKNMSSRPDISGAGLTCKSYQDTFSTVNFALGYYFANNMRGEIEHIAIKDLTYAFNPVIERGTTARNLRTTLSASSLLLTANFDYPLTDYLKPFVSFTLGLNNSKISSRLTPIGLYGDERNLSILSIAYGAGLGLRLRMVDNWYLESSYRYLILNKSIKIEHKDRFVLQGQHMASIFGVNISFLF